MITMGDCFVLFRFGRFRLVNVYDVSSERTQRA